MEWVLTRLKFRKKELYVECKAASREALQKLQNEGKAFRLVLAYRSKLASQKQFFYFSGNWSQGVFRGTLAYQDVKWKPIYYDLQIEDARNEQKEYEPIDVGKLRNLIRFPLYDGKHRWSNGMFCHPFITPERTIAFQYRERTKADTVCFRMQEAGILAWFFLTKPYWKKRSIYLVYEKFCMMAQDNGYYFFRYCMEHDAEKQLNGEIYYIIDPKAEDAKKVEKYKGHVIPFMSVRHKLYLLAAKMLISTDTRKHAYAWRKRMSFIDHYLRHKPLVFLQHGVTAFKRVDYIYGKGKFGDCRVFVATSDYEKKIIEENFGYAGDEIAVTGFARWDVLEDCSEKIVPGSIEERMILVMPTWRNWLEEVDDETFVKSRYYQTYMKLLNDASLQEVLEKNQLHLCFYIHPKFREYMKEFACRQERIRMVPFGEEPLNELMMKCKMLVTDYSSVAWDVYYQKKPVVFFQFDLDAYLEAHGSYMDMDTELFGERETECSGLIRRLEEYAQTGFTLKETYARLHERYYKYTDRDNSKRIVEHIQKLS